MYVIRTHTFQNVHYFSFSCVLKTQEEDVLLTLEVVHFNCCYAYVYIAYTYSLTYPPDDVTVGEGAR